MNNRKEIITKLMGEGFTINTLTNMSDKEIGTLSKTLFNETVMIKTNSPTSTADIENAKKQGKTIETYESEMKEEKPSAGLTKKKKSEIVKKAKKGEDIGKKGKGFEKIEKKAKKSGAKDPKAVAASVMWKNIKREGVEVSSWVKTLAEDKYFSAVTSKGEIMEVINQKLNETRNDSFKNMTNKSLGFVKPTPTEQKNKIQFPKKSGNEKINSKDLKETETMSPIPTTKVKKGHNGIPEFMTYDSIKDVATSPEPITKPAQPITKPEPGTKPKTPYNPGPGPNPKPKALRETKKNK